LVAELDRKWLTANCTGDDLQTSETRIISAGAALRVQTNIEFVRWWSLTNCAADRNHEIKAKGPLSIALTLASGSGDPHLEAQIIEFGAEISVLGMRVDEARPLIKKRLQDELNGALQRLNASLVQPEIAALHLKLEAVHFADTGNDGLVGDIQVTALITPEQLNDVLRMLATGGRHEQ
jgi:hypothetical protein